MTIGAIERAGGKIRTAYYDLESLRAAVDPLKWFKDGNPIPGRKMPPHSLLGYYANANNRGYFYLSLLSFLLFAFRYLAEDSDITKSEHRLAEILEYERNVDPQLSEVWRKESKKPNEIFLGLKPGSLVSLADRKVFEPTHPAIIEHYNPSEPLADHLR